MARESDGGRVGKRTRSEEPEIGRQIVWWPKLDSGGRQRERATKQTLHLIYSIFSSELAYEMARNGSFGDNLCPNRGSKGP